MLHDHTQLDRVCSNCEYIRVVFAICHLQDTSDDQKLGLKSTALHFGADSPRWLAGFSVATMTALAAAGWSASMGLPFAVVSIGRCGCVRV